MWRALSPPTPPRPAGSHAAPLLQAGKPTPLAPLTLSVEEEREERWRGEASWAMQVAGQLLARMREGPSPCGPLLTLPHAV